MEKKDLIKIAFQAKERSYSPYSDFQVGSALECENGSVYIGANVENSSYGATQCAERNAIMHAVMEQNTKFKRIVITGAHRNGKSQYAFPCGICRQVMMEFADPNEFEVIIAKSEDEFKSFKLKELLPYGFGPSDLME